MITALAHICIGADDLEKTRWFYCDVLGFDKKFDFIKDGELFGFYLQISDNNFIEVFRNGADAPEAGRQRIKHFCLETDDIDAIKARIEDHGLETRPKKLGADNSWQFWCTDPNGIDMEFHQYTAESSQHTGADCIVDW